MGIKTEWRWAKSEMETFGCFSPKHRPVTYKIILLILTIEGLVRSTRIRIKHLFKVSSYA